MPFILERQSVPSAGFDHQLMHLPAIPDGPLQFRGEFIRHVNRKPPLSFAAI
jgi:hypothetical protein